MCLDLSIRANQLNKRRTCLNKDYPSFNLHGEDNILQEKHILLVRTLIKPVLT